MDEKDKSQDGAGLPHDDDARGQRPVSHLKVLLLFGVALLVLYGIVGSLQHNRVATAVTFRTSWEQAAGEARESGKVIFADFYADWCGPCRAMDKEVFSRQEFAAALEPMAVPLRVDLQSEAGAALAARYNVEFIPNYIVLQADGEVLARGDGEISGDRLLNMVRDAAQKAETDQPGVGRGQQ
jgi:thiol:disulfide interchange protein